MIIFEEFGVKTTEREILVNITNEINRIVKISNVREGICCIFVPHTTAAITINENADPSVIKDILSCFNELIPQSACFSHVEGNSDAHIKSSLTGPSIDLIVHDGNLKLGTWQAIFFCEYDGPRHGKVYVQIQGE